MDQERYQKTEIREEGFQSEKGKDILSYFLCLCDDDDDKTFRGSIVYLKHTEVDHLRVHPEKWIRYFHQKQNLVFF